MQDQPASHPTVRYALTISIAIAAQSLQFSELYLDLFFREAVPLVPQLMQIEAVTIVAGQATQEGVAVLSSAKACSHMPALKPEPIHSFNGTPGILLCETRQGVFVRVLGMAIDATDAAIYMIRVCPCLTLYAKVT